MTDAQMAVAQIRLILLLQLWTAGPLARIHLLTIVEQLHDLPECPFALLEGGAPQFRISVPFPPYKDVKPAVPEGAACTTIPWMLIPDAAGLVPYIRRLLAIRAANTDAPNVVFTKPVEFYEQKLKRLLKRIDPTGRLTSSKIAFAMYHRIIRMTGKDVLGAGIITGQKFHGSRVQFYYSCRYLPRLQKIYCDAVSSLRSSIDDEAAYWGKSCDVVQRQPEHIRVEPQELYVGTRLNPTRNALRDGVRRMQDDLEGINLMYNGGFNKYWNRFTLYTLLYYMFSIASRCVRQPTPIRVVENISPLNQVRFIQQKGDDKGTKGIAIATLDGPLAQLHSYEGLLDRTGMRLRIPTDWAACFLGDTNRPEDIRPGTWGPRMQEYIPFPAGVARRWIYNRILDFTDCPPEVVRCGLMTHSVIGDEPWQPTATLSQAKCRSLISNHVQEVLKDIGFCHIEARL